MPKATHKRINQDFLDQRVAQAEAKGFGKAKWIGFCETMMAEGYYLKLYEARKTVSKYITVIKPDDPSHKFKVRFSNHRPIKHREVSGDCDFFVGVTNLGVTTTEQAIEATLTFFKQPKEKKNAKTNDDTLKHRPFDCLRDYGNDQSGADVGADSQRRGADHRNAGQQPSVSGGGGGSHRKRKGNR